MEYNTISSCNASVALWIITTTVVVVSDTHIRRNIVHRDLAQKMERQKYRAEDRVQETTTPTGLYVAEPAIAIPSSHSARWPKGGERPCGDYTVLDDAMAPEI